MTKYVLNPGGIKHQPELKKKFQELVKGLGERVHVTLSEVLKKYDNGD